MIVEMPDQNTGFRHKILISLSLELKMLFIIIICLDKGAIEVEIWENVSEKFP